MGLQEARIDELLGMEMEMGMEMGTMSTHVLQCVFGHGKSEWIAVQTACHRSYIRMVSHLSGHCGDGDGDWGW